MTEQPPKPQGFWANFFSERMVFGILFIVGLISILHELILRAPRPPPEIVTLVAGGVGALGTAAGIIAQAVWKTDKTEKQNADTISSMASALATSTPSVEVVKEKTE